MISDIFGAGKKSFPFQGKGLLPFPAKTLYKKTPSIGCFKSELPGPCGRGRVEVILWPCGGYDPSSILGPGPKHLFNLF